MISFRLKDQYKLIKDQKSQLKDQKSQLKDQNNWINDRKCQSHKGSKCFLFKVAK